MSLPFSDDVLLVCAKLLEDSTPHDVRKAMEANLDVMQFAQRSPSEATSAASTQQEFVMLCKCSSRSSQEQSGTFDVVAVTDPTAIITRDARMFVREKSTTNSEAVQALVNTAVLLSKRASTTEDESAVVADGTATATAAALLPATLGVADLNIQTLNPARPMDSLQQLLERFYDPLLRTQHPQVGVQTQVQDLIGGIRSMHEVLPKVDILSYVPEELRQLCASHPNSDLPGLVELLGERAREPSFLRHLLLSRNRCNRVLPLDELLAGDAEDTTETEGKTIGDGAARRAVHTATLYWQRVLAWVDDILAQLQCREWRLTNRLLGHRVETTYEPEYVNYSQLVRTYLKYLDNIPEHRIATASAGQFPGLMDEVFAAVLRPSRYPAKLVLKLLSGLVSELAECWVRFVSALDPFPPADAPTDSVGSPPHPSPPVASLTTLQGHLLLLQNLQGRFVSAEQTLRKQARLLLISHGTALLHPRVEGLTRRCVLVRGLIETHFLLVEQLKTALNISTRFSGAQTDAADSTDGAAEGGTAFADEIEAAYTRCVAKLMAASREELLLWRAGAAAQEAIDAAVKEYHDVLAKCDDRIAAVVSQIFSTEHSGSAADGRTSSDREIMYADRTHGNRMFRVYSHFRFLSLPNVQRVVQGFQTSVAEGIAYWVRLLQERYFNVKLSKRIVSFLVIEHRITPLAAQILWAMKLEHDLSVCMMQRDYVTDHGWHQLLSLRNIARLWRLDQKLADFFGFPLEDLVTDQLYADSEVHGTAYAMAYLQLLYPEEEGEWMADPHIFVARQLLDSAADPATIQAARDRLVLVGAANVVRSDRTQLREIRSTRATFVKRLWDEVKAWCAESRAVLAAIPLDPDTSIMTSPIFYVAVVADQDVHSSEHTPSTHSARAASPTSFRGPSVSNESIMSLFPPPPTPEPVLRLDVRFPWQLCTIATDLRFLDGAALLQSTSAEQDSAFIREVVRVNEHRGRLAHCIAELVWVYYATVNGDDKSLVLLATDEYEAVNVCLANGARYRWSNDIELVRYVQVLTEKLQTFVETVQRVREKTDSVYAKIQSFHVRAFHPEAIALRVNTIRRTVNALQLRSVHAYLWVRLTQPLLDSALLEQIKFLLHGWTLDFLSMRHDTKYLTAGNETDIFHLTPLRLRMCVVYKEVRLESSPAAWRSYWIGQLNRFLAWVDTLPRLYNEEDAEVESTSELGQLLDEVQGRGRAAGYGYLFDRLPALALAEPLNAIEQCIHDAMETEQTWRSSQQFLNFDVGVLQQRFGTDLHRWNSALQLINNVSTQLMDYTQPNKLLGGIVILAEEAQLELSRKLDQVCQHIYAKFKDLLEQQLQDTYEHVAAEHAKLESLNIMDNMNDTVAFSCEVPRIRQELTDAAPLVDLMAEAEHNLKKVGYEFPADWTHAVNVAEEFRSLQEGFERKLKALQLRQPALLESSKTAIARVEAEVSNLQREFSSLDDVIAEQSPEAAQRTIEHLYERLASLNEEAKRVTATQQSLGAPAPDFTELDSLLSRIEGLRKVWEHVVDASTALRKLGDTPFFEMLPRQLQQGLAEVEARMEDVPEDLKSFQAYAELVDHISVLLSYNRLMENLRSDAMAPLERAQRYWQRLKEELQTSWTLPSLRVRDIWESEPHDNMAIYNDVVEMAQGERRIEVQLQSIATFWEGFTFSTTVYKKQHVLLRGWETVFDRLSDDLSTFGGMRASPYFTSQHIIATTNDFEARLNKLRQVLETLMEVQKREVYLDSIFTNSAEIRPQLPHDAAQFDRTSRELLSILPRVRPNGTAPKVRADFFEDDELLPTLAQLLSQLVAVQKALKAFLDTQRRQFPRFFFVGDDDLLEIMGNSKDPMFINKHLKKMYTALNMLLLEDGKRPAKIRGFASAEGEEVRFVDEQVRFTQRPLHDWLTDVQMGMVRTLRASTIRATRELQGVDSFTAAWLDSYPTQVLCLAMQLWWVQLEEKHLTAATSAGTRAPLKSTDSCPVTQGINELLATLASSGLDASSSPLARHRCEQLITTAVYQRDTSRLMSLRRVTSTTDFSWLSIMRPYIVMDGGAHSSPNSARVECRMADAVQQHGFEYTGCMERLVQTPLTDKCYLTLMQALHTQRGGAPVGPAGTGKTETVKALGAQLGRHVLVFNCDEAFDFRAVSRIFLGLGQVGAWGCFDEFNRLEERILSALSQQILVIQRSLRARSPTVELSGQQVPLHHDVAIFVTMNPGYAGRSNLPSNLKQLFRSVMMTVPDREAIAEVMLFSQGFQTAEVLARKVVPLFRLCEDQFQHQSHYDFGLRALKSVLLAAGSLKRAAAGTQPHDAGKTNVALRESDVILQSIINTIAPKLVTEDLVLFYPLLHDFFPNQNIPDPTKKTLRKAVERVCAESGLDPAPGWVEKICQLQHTIQTRHGVMLVGPSGAGKTAAWKALMAASVGLDRQQAITAYVITPKVLDKNELFGTLDVTTREWKDGVFTTILRKIIDSLQPAHEADGAESTDGVTEVGTPLTTADDAADLAGGAGNPAAPTKQHHHWIIFDGDVDPEWAENLNSVLDDNRLLTLPTGERLALPASVRILFEVQDLQYATPATVSRCGMLWFSEGLVPMSSLLKYAYHQLVAKPLVDHRGRRLAWTLEEDMYAVAAHGNVSGPNGGFGTASSSTGGGAGSGGGVSCTRGSAFGSYVVISASAHGSPMAPASSAVGGEVDITSSAVQTLTETFALDRQNTTMTASAMSPLGAANRAGSDVAHTGTYNSPVLGRTGGKRTGLVGSFERIRSIFVTSWGSAFSPSGLLDRGLRLAASNAFRASGIMAFCALQQLQSILALLLDGMWRTFDQQLKSESTLPEEVLQTMAEKVLQSATFWGLGAPMDHANRGRLARELGFSPQVRGTPETMENVEVDAGTGEWVAVRDRVQETHITLEQVGSTDTVISTVDTSRHEDLLKAWLSAGRSVILCGPPGSGKTMSVASALHSSQQYDAIFLSLSSGTTVETLLKALEHRCTVHNTAHGLLMAPSSGKRLLLFCDEVNLPALDKYGTQVVIQLLRQFIECRGYFRAQDNRWVTIKNIQVVGACNPPTDPGRVPLSLRFLRWAPVLFVDFPSTESLEVIYTTYCRAVLQFNEKLQHSCAEPLAKAMVHMYGVSQAEFTPIQQPHYLYSPRELSRWIRAVYEGIATWGKETQRSMTAEALVRLAIHEGLRVFADRLVSAPERLWTDKAVDESFRKFFPSVSGATYRRPILYTTLMSPTYADCSRDDLRAFLQKRLATFCSEEVSMPLVIFDGMIDHVVRIDRVLHQPLGHLLIAGTSGVGKTIVSRLVAWMDGFATFWLKVDRSYNLNNFKDDLRSILRRAGCKRERICFLFDESNIMEPSFLEYMNALLSSGEVPGLFEGEDWQTLIQEIREAAEESANKGTPGGSTPNAADYVNLASEESCYQWFLGNVRQLLHVIFTINPASSEFSTRTVASPALLNRCTIDWFGDWDQATLRQIARERFRSLVLRPSCGDAFESEERVHAALVHAVCRIHLGTQELNALMRTHNANQGTFITPRHFTDCLSQFVRVYADKGSSAVEQQQHLKDGLEKLNATSKEVETQQARLRQDEATMAERSVKAQAMLETIVNETETTKREKTAAEELRRQLRAEEEKINAESSSVERQLAEAEPALEDAEKALNTVKSENLREIRVYSTPPPMVKRVLEAVMVLMGEKNSSDWDVLKNYLRRDDFLSSVKAYHPSNVTPAARDRVRVLAKDKNFNVEAAYRASKAAGPLLQWVFAQVQYSEIFTEVRPMREKIDALNAARQSKVHALGKTEKEIREKEQSLQRFKAEYQANTMEVAEIKRRVEVVSAKCERAAKILSQLLDERERWSRESENYDSEARTNLGACLLSSAFLTYIGFFDEYTRRFILFPTWTEYITQSGIPLRAELNLREFLSQPTQQLEWERCGLPNDDLCLENAILIDRSERYTLLIDPSDTASAYLQELYADKKITKASFSRAGYLKQLEMAAQFGYPIIMEDAEFMDPAMGPLLNREYRHHNGRTIVRIGAQDVEMSRSFRLFLFTRDSNYQPSPDLAGEVTVVNFTITQASLLSQCLYQILLHERPEVNVQRTELLKRQGEYQVRLRVLEQSLLTSISKSHGSLLDNDQLISTLADLKEETTAIGNDMTSSNNSMDVIREIEHRFRPLASLASKIYFALQRFCILSSFYRYEVHFMFRVLRDALATLPERPKAAENDSELSRSLEVESRRMHQLKRNLFTLVYRRVVRGMFREDHLVFGLRLVQLWSSIESIPDHPGFPPPCIEEDELKWLMEGLHAQTSVASARQAPSTASGSRSLSVSQANLSVALPTVFQKDGMVRLGVQAATALAQLLQKSALSNMAESLNNPSHAEAWVKFFTAPSPIDLMNTLPSRCFASGTRDARRCFLLTLLIYYVRRDGFIAAASRLLQLVLEEDAAAAPSPTDGDAAKKNETTKEESALERLSEEDPRSLPSVMKELSSFTPLLLVTSAGGDPSTPIDELAHEHNATLRVVAMGSPEGVDNATRYLTEGIQTGCWVLLKNVHLARAFMDSVEKRLHFEHLAKHVHPGFRLILAAERGTHDSPFVLSSSGRVSSERSAAQLSVLPVSLLEISVVVVYELPPGMKASLLQTYGTLPMPEPREKELSATSLRAQLYERLYLASAWLHGVVMERLLHVPLGWSQAYEFSTTEYHCVIQVVQAWTQEGKAGDGGGDGEASLTVAWDALHKLVARTIYGGKISNAFDQRALDVFCSRLLANIVFDSSCNLVQAIDPTVPASGAPSLVKKNHSSREELLQWVHALPDGVTDTQWLGLPSSASQVALGRSGLDTVTRLAAVQTVFNEELAAELIAAAKDFGRDDSASIASSSAGFNASSSQTRTSAPRKKMLSSVRWAVKIHNDCSQWIPALRTSFEALHNHLFVQHAFEVERGHDEAVWSHTTGAQAKDAASAVASPLTLAMQREVVMAVTLLQRLLADTQDLLEISEGNRKPSSAHRLLLTSLAQDLVPAAWAAHIPHNVTTVVGPWIANIQECAEHLCRLADAAQDDKLGSISIALGLLFSPGSFLTASRQHHARGSKNSLETLQPHVEVLTEEQALATPPTSSGSLTFSGLTLCSAVVGSDGRCSLVRSTSSTASLVSAVGLRWTWAAPAESAAAGKDTPVGGVLSLEDRLNMQQPKDGSVHVPLYLSHERDVLLEVVKVPLASSEKDIDVWYEHGVCLTAWTPNN